MAPHDPFTVHSEQAAGLTTVVACGEVALATAPLLRDELLLRLEPGAQIRLHLGGVSFMDSSGVHVLLASRRRADLLGADFGVVEPSPQVRRLLQISGVTKLLVAAAEPSGAAAGPQ